MILLESFIKFVILNVSFIEKKLGYIKFRFLLIRIIVEEILVGNNIIINLVVKDLKIFEKWDF